MSLVYAGVCSHAPGISGRAHLAENTVKRDEFLDYFDRMRREIEDCRPDVLIVIAAEHFANFFMDNMPPFCIGMADHYDGPIENEEWLAIPKRRSPGNANLSERLIRSVMQTVDTAYAQEWKFDHGVIVPLHFLVPENDLPVIPVNINCQSPPLTPLNRVWTFGKALRTACDSVPERIALVGTGGISHWPATPDTGKINEAWDREFLDHLVRQDRKAMLSYSDEEIYRDGGQGGFEIRTYIAAAAAAGGPLDVQFYTAELPIFAVGCAVGRFEISDP